MNHIKHATLITLAAAALPLPAASQTPDTNWDAAGWTFGATIYGYFPSLGGKTSFPVDAGGSSIEVSSDKIIDSLKFAFMGTLDAHNGRWGMFTDVMYLDLGGGKSGSREFTIGSNGLPVGTSADLNLDVRGTIWTLAGEYRVASTPEWKVDALLGARSLDLKQTLSWSIAGNLGPIAAPGRTGKSEVKENAWDAIVGVKGRYAFGERREWLVPFYADIGTGQTDLTWQAAAGLGYAFRWGDVIAMWRYLDYNFKSGKKIEDVNLNGPMIGVTFRW